MEEDEFVFAVQMVVLVGLLALAVFLMKVLYF